MKRDYEGRIINDSNELDLGYTENVKRLHIQPGEYLLIKFADTAPSDGMRRFKDKLVAMGIPESKMLFYKGDIEFTILVDETRD